MRTTSSVLCLSVLLAIPSLAAANEVVLPPLVPRGATSVQQVANITQLMGSEMDFMNEVETVIELPKAPSGYNKACIDSASCLTRIGREAGGDQVVAGTLRVTDALIYLDLVYYDVSRGRYLRRKSFELTNQPEIIADNMDDVVKELITGQAPKVDDDAVADDYDLTDFDDDLDLGFDESDFEDARRDEEAERARRAAEAERKRKAAAKQQAEDEARRRAEAAEQARLEEQRRQAEAEAEARRAAEAEARRRAEAEEARLAQAAAARRAEEDARESARREAARRAAEEEEATRRAAAAALDEEEEEAFDPSMISFGSSSIIVEDDDGPSVVEDEPVRTREAPTPSYFEDLDDEDDFVAEIDEPEPARVRTPEPRRERVVREQPKREGSGFDSDPTSVQLTLRGGYNQYYNLGFVTYGGELSVALGDSGVRALLGVEAWSVQRTIPERFQAEAGAPTEWNTIVPLSAGVVYAFDVADGRVKPYIGADVIGAQYYVPEEQGGLGNWSIGARARGGLDLMVVRNFGINLNAGVGFWSGKDWVVIEKDVRNAGLLPQVSAGTVFAF